MAVIVFIGGGNWRTHRPSESNWQTLSHNVVSSNHRHVNIEYIFIFILLLNSWLILFVFIWCKNEYHNQRSTAELFMNLKIKKIYCTVLSHYLISHQVEKTRQGFQRVQILGRTHEIHLHFSFGPQPLK